MTRVRPFALVLLALVAISPLGAAEQPADGGKVDVRARMTLADGLASRGKHVEAADEYVWLWGNMLKHRESMYGVRLSFMASDMERLAKSSPEAKAKFVVLRDKAAKGMEGAKIDGEAVIDWVVLNRVVGDTKATVEWYQRVKNDKRWAPHIARTARDLSQLFIDEKRYADLGTLYTDPLNYLRAEHKFLKEIAGMTGGNTAVRPNMDEEERRRIEDGPLVDLRREAAPVYGGLLAAGREEAAGKYAALAREIDPSVRMLQSLVEAALDADQPREEHRAWLKAAKDQTLEPLQKRVDKAIEAHKARKSAPPSPATPALPASHPDVEKK